MRIVHEKCITCKHYKESIDVDYVPTCYCKLNNFKNAETCEHNKDKYTFGDYLEEIFPGIFILLLIGLFALFMNLK